MCFCNFLYFRNIDVLYTPWTKYTQIIVILCLPWILVGPQESAVYSSVQYHHVPDIQLLVTWWPWLAAPPAVRRRTCTWSQPSAGPHWAVVQRIRPIIHSCQLTADFMYNYTQDIKLKFRPHSVFITDPDQTYHTHLLHTNCKLQLPSIEFKLLILYKQKIGTEIPPEGWIPSQSQTFKRKDLTWVRHP